MLGEQMPFNFIVNNLKVSLSKYNSEVCDAHQFTLKLQQVLNAHTDASEIALDNGINGTVVYTDRSGIKVKMSWTFFPQAKS